MEAPDISVVIPTLHRLDALERCIAALVAQDFPRDRFEIIVADAGFDSNVRQVAGRWAMLTHGAPLLRYVPTRESLGPAGARNAGWRAARGEIVAFTNDESVPRRNWLTEGWKAMESGAIAASGVVESPLEGVAPEVELDPKRAREPGIAAANCFVQRQSLRALGGFDERFTSAWDDARDLQFTLAKVSGEVVAAPNAVVERPVHRGGWDATLHQYRKMVFDALLFKKHPRLYREHVRRTPPWNYYFIVAALAAILAGAVARAPLLAWAGLATWTVLTVELCVRRLRAAPHPGHVTEIVATSLAIPAIAVFWRLAGALRFRVFFL
ncbi:MAG: glycosyltransferase family 2 protein [Usitatibacter sp.]